MSEGTAVYELDAHDAAQVLSRALGLFAQQDRALASVIAHSDGDRMQAMLRLRHVDRQRATVLAEKLRALPMVERVDFTFAPAVGERSVLRGRLRLADDAQDVAAGHLLDVGR